MLRNHLVKDSLSMTIQLDPLLGGESLELLVQSAGARRGSRKLVVQGDDDLLPVEDFSPAGFFPGLNQLAAGSVVREKQVNFKVDFHPSTDVRYPCRRSQRLIEKIHLSSSQRLSGLKGSQAPPPPRPLKKGCLRGRDPSLPRTAFRRASNH